MLLSVVISDCSCGELYRTVVSLLKLWLVGKVRHCD